MVIDLKTIKNSKDIKIIENKSFFIGIIKRINSKEEINPILENIKNTYKDATHYTYAYKVNNEVKANDDNEPSKTAGMPILEVLNKFGLDNCLLIVVRYFGGIKLGAGGLIRTYRKTAIETVKNAELIELEKGYIIKDVIYSLKKEGYLDTNKYERRRNLSIV